MWRKSVRRLRAEWRHPNSVLPYACIVLCFALLMLCLAGINLLPLPESADWSNEAVAYSDTAVPSLPDERYAATD